MLTPQTGNEKMDQAYMNMQTHVDSFEKFDEFFNYFEKIVKTDDKAVLSKWLLKVLFVQMKYRKHPFDELLEKVEPGKKVQLKKWLEDNLRKVGENK